MQHTIRAGALIALLLAAPPALAEPAPGGDDRSLKAAAGQEVQLGVYANVTAECSGLPAPDLRIATPPSRGTLTVRLVALTLKSESKTCPDRKLPALGLFYRAGPDWGVTDTVRVEAVAGSSTKEQTFTIAVTQHME